MKSNILFYIFLSTSFFACNSDRKSHDKASDFARVQKYVNNDLGWSIEIPEGFQSLSGNRLEQREQSGRAAMGEKSDVDVNTNGLRHLVNFQRNQFNLFSATAQSYNEKENGGYSNSIKLTNKAIYDAYNRQKIKVDTTSGKETIAGKPFHVFYVKIYGPTGNVIMNQMVYSHLLRGKDFSVNINYNNERDSAAMLSAFHRSSFTR